MKLSRKTITLHGGRELYVLTPLLPNPSVTAGYNPNDYVLIWGNGSGYQYLAECFSIAAELKKNEILYIPTQFRPDGEFKELFNNCAYDLNVVCVNYCELQISQKGIDRILRIRTYAEDVTARSPMINKHFIEQWKTDRRLTVKISRKNMCISTNRDGFYSLAYGANHLKKYGDTSHDDFLPHAHYDRNENTSKSVGVTLYHWQNK